MGEDQTQHLELTRELADSFNRKFSPKKRCFPIPTQLISKFADIPKIKIPVKHRIVISAPCKRVLSLKDPSSKMSKSSPVISSRILLTDTTSNILSKFKGAVTDSIRGITYDPVNRPGAANLLSIFAACTNEQAEGVAARYADKGHAELKIDVADAVENILKGPRAEFERLRKDQGYLAQVAKEGAEKAQELSGKTMKEVRDLVGFC